MKGKILLLLLLFAGCRIVSHAQGVAINPNGFGPDNSAGLDVDFPDKGILFPRLTEFQRNSILFPAKGLICFQVDNDPGLYINSGTPLAPSWVRFTTSFTGWQTGGNAGTIDYTHFLGTTDSVPLNLLVNNQPAGRISPDGELRLGYKAAMQTSGTMNTAIGSQALWNNLTGSGNVALGYQAGYYEMGSNKLYIDNSSSATPLIYGDFANNHVMINGNVGIGAYPGSNALTVSGPVSAPLLYDYHNSSFYLDPASVSILNDVRATIFYDYNNTSFYVDPSATSFLNTLNTNIVMDIGNPSFYLDPASVSHLNDVRAYIFYDRGDNNYFLDPSSTSILNEVRASIFTDRESSSYFVDPGNTGNSAFLAGSVGLGVAPSTSYKLDVNGAVRASLIYDYNNTTFYLDPSSVSIMNDVRATLYYDRDNNNFFVDPAGSSYTNIIYANLVYDASNTSYYLDPASVSQLNDVRAFIFYDRTDNNYFLDPSSISVLNELRASTFKDRESSSYYVDPGNTGNSAALAGNVCIGGTSATEKLEVYTSSTVGMYTTSGWTHSSDARLKKNILPLDATLDKVLQLQARRFDYIAESSTESRHIGFLAQEVEPLFPEFVMTGADGYKSITYGEMVPVLSEAIREQHQIILSLETQNRELRSRIEQLEADYGERLKKLEEALGQSQPVTSAK